MLEGQAVQLLNIEWRVDENKKMNDWANCYVSLLPPGGEAYRLEKYGYAIDDGGDGYNTSTKTCRVDFVIPEFYRSGVYSVQQINMFDQAGNKSAVYFSEKSDDESPVLVPIVTINPDTTPPELDINRILIGAKPTNPDAPNGETIVTLSYFAKDDISGLGTVSYNLRDPQGISHHYYHYHENFYSSFFEGDALSWASYDDTVVLPVGSAPGIWGLSELYLEDKAHNFKVYDFTETVRFDLIANSGLGESKDNVPPTLNLIGSQVVKISQESVFGDPGATAYDNVDGDLTSKIVVIGEVNTSLVGSYALTYKVTDSEGNEAVSLNRTVIVEKVTNGDDKQVEKNTGESGAAESFGEVKVYANNPASVLEQCKH